MSLIEMNHPLAEEISTISEASASGLGQYWNLPSHIKVNYVSPLDDEDGCTMLYIADWQTENMTSVSIPVFSDVESGPSVIYGDNKVLSGARIVIRDFLGRHFAVNTLTDVAATPYAQLDVVSEGIVHHSVPNGLSIVQIGEFDGPEYNVFYQMARAQASLALLHETAVEFLGR